MFTENKIMARRPAVVTPKRVVESEANGFSSPNSPPQKSQSSSFISFCVVFIVVVLLIGYMFGDSVFHQTPHRNEALDHGDGQSDETKSRSFPEMRSAIDALERLTNREDTDEDTTDHLLKHLLKREDHRSSHSGCRVGVCNALPVLQDVYGKFMHKILHIGPGTCGVVSKLLKEENIEVWGIQPFEMKAPIHKLCNNFVKKGIVRVAEVYRPLPYRSQSFSLVLATDTLENLSSKRLNKTLPELSRLSTHRLVVFIGHRNLQMTSVESVDETNISRKLIKSSNDKPLKIRNRMWWLRRFEQAGLTEDEETTKRFENIQQEKSYKTKDYIFHLVVPHSISLSR
ncbi:hypothetical protein O6H91_10G081100 [Diphasiastrum complanatum]|uniref:Uncharacterized protein n=2 Tax=Diphasiastrum complanatum TaxID=34168 RepID=A0ACC2CIR6_DIPCM|nr:hypothetical protein O6H91_10G081100 [Diphasiastrum complanatum]